MKKILVLALFLSGCNTLETGAKAINYSSGIFDFDTNGYYSKSTRPDTKYCQYRVNNVEVWKPCSKH